MDAIERELRTALDLASSLGDEDKVAEAIAEYVRLKKDAERYRWLRDTAVRFAPANERDEMVWCVIGKNAMECSPCEGNELDAEIDAALKTPNG